MKKLDYFWCGNFETFFMSKSGFIYSSGNNKDGSLGIGNKK